MLGLDGLTPDKTRHGKRRWFYRKRGAKKQLRGIYDEPEDLKMSQELLDAYNDAKARLEGDRPSLKGQGTLGWLIERYLQKRRFANPLTRKDYRSVLGGIQKTHGHRPYATMAAKQVEDVRDEAIREEGGAVVGENAGNKRVKKLRVLFDWEIKNVGLLKDNPARRADLIPVASRGYIPWTREDVLTFEDCHPAGSKARLALALYLYTGQRKSDVVQWGPLNDRHGRLVYIQHKGRTQKIVPRSIPIVAPLRAVLNATDLGKVTWLETEYDLPFSIAGFGHRMRLWCDEAGLHHLSGHGIRKTTGIIAAERRCSSHEIMEILGVTLAVAEGYCREADKIRLADSGFARAFGDEE